MSKIVTVTVEYDHTVSTETQQEGRDSSCCPQLGSSTPAAEDQESINAKDNVAYDIVGKVVMNENVAYVATIPSTLPEYEEMGSSIPPAEDEESIDTKDNVAYDEMGKVVINENVAYISAAPSTIPEYEEITVN